MPLRILTLAMIVMAQALHAQTATLDGSFQTKFFPNLWAGDSVINIGNTGASARGTTALGSPIGGTLCVNFYAFSPDEEMESCCTCSITPNGVVTTTARHFISRALTLGVPPSLTIKLVATVPPIGGRCDASSPLPPLPTFPAAGALAPGLIAFGTNIHAAPVGGSLTQSTFETTETAFTPASLSTPELTRVASICGFILANGSGFGVCPGCAAGAAGAIRD